MTTSLSRCPDPTEATYPACSQLSLQDVLLNNALLPKCVGYWQYILKPQNAFDAIQDTRILKDGQCICMRTPRRYRTQGWDHAKIPRRPNEPTGDPADSLALSLGTEQHLPGKGAAELSAGPPNVGNKQRRLVGQVLACPAHAQLLELRDGGHARLRLPPHHAIVRVDGLAELFHIDAALG